MSSSGSDATPVNVIAWLIRGLVMSGYHEGLVGGAPLVEALETIGVLNDGRHQTGVVAFEPSGNRGIERTHPPSLSGLD